MKKIISMMVVFILLTMSVSAIASEIEFIDIYQVGEIEYYKKDDVLYIQGKGDMPDFDFMTPSPFTRFKSIKRVVIKNGVTSIGNLAFFCSHYEEIEVPESVLKIGEKAFYGCSNLKKVTFIGDGLESIEAFAFVGCVELLECKLPESVKYIKSAAFHGCYKLSEIVIGDNVEYVYPNAFEYCEGAESIYIGKAMSEYMLNLSSLNSLKTITVAKDNAIYTVIDNVLFTKDKKTLVKFPSGSLLAEYKVPEFTEKVDNYAFYNCYNLKTVELPSHIDHKDLWKPSTLRFVGEGVYNSYSVMEYMGDIIYYTKKESFFTIYQVDDKNNDKSFKLPENLGDCTDARIDSNVYTMDKIEIVDASCMKEIPMWLFRESEAKGVVLPKGLKEIKQLSFTGCKNLKAITLPESLEKIERLAFCGSSLEEITIPKNVDYIGEGAFSFCGNLKRIVIEEGRLKKLGNENANDFSYHCFNNISEEVTVFLPKSLEWISDNEFKNFEYLHRGMIGWREFGKITIIAPKDSGAHLWAEKNNLNYMTP